MAAKRKADPFPPQMPYPTAMCLRCGGGARPFDSGGVPILLDYLARKATREQLQAAAREKLGGGCLVAPKCGVSVCKDGTVQP